MKKKRIIIQYGNVGKLAKFFGCSTTCINQALRYITASELAKEIRETAINEFDGQVIEYESKI